MRVVVNSLIGLNALLVVRKYLLKDGYNLSNCAVTTTIRRAIDIVVGAFNAFAATLKALYCELQRSQHFDIFSDHSPVSG